MQGTDLSEHRMDAEEVGTDRWRERFERWAADKLRRATAAPLPRYVTDLDRPEPGMDAIGNEWTASPNISRRRVPLCMFMGTRTRTSPWC